MAVAIKMEEEKKEISDLSKRFLEVLEVKNYSGYKLAKEVPEITESKITFIRTGRNNPSKEILDALLAKFPDLSMVWLLTGEGEMFSDGKRQPQEAEDSSIVRIPFYEDVVMIGGVAHTADMQGITMHNEMIDAGDWFRDATGAMRVHGNSMYPNYPSGCIVAFKQVNDISLLLYGQDYMVETTEYRVIKRVQKSTQPESLLLCSYNNEKDDRNAYVHENFDVPIAKIARIFRILGKVERTESSRMVYTNR